LAGGGHLGLRSGARRDHDRGREEMIDLPEAAVAAVRDPLVVTLDISR
jgi:hypothetical protein